MILKYPDFIYSQEMTRRKNKSFPFDIAFVAVLCI